MNLEPEFVLQVVTTIATGVGIFGGVKSKIAALSERVEALRETVRIQGEQIDRLRERRAQHAER